MKQMIDAEWREVEDVPLPGDRLAEPKRMRWLCTGCGAVLHDPAEGCECEEAME